MKNKQLLIIGLVIVVVLLAGIFVFSSKKSTPVTPTPEPTPESAVIQLTEDQQPKVNLKFSADAHYVTVSITNIHADQLEYDLIYEAMVKNSKLQTGVNASTKMDGKTTYSEKQLLGSESSGHFTYHTNIQNAVMNLTLRDSSRRSIFTATYPFEVKAGASSDLVAASE